ncbi:MAG TPA: O-antigen ligase family protein, partial [Bacilli bacterium]
MKKTIAKTSSRTSSFAETRSVLFWLIMAFTVAFMFIAPFARGLFNGGLISFERPIYIALAWSAAALFLLAIHFFTHWKMNHHRDLLSLAVWLIPLCYLLAMIQAVSYHAAMNELFLHVMYAVFFLIGAYFAGKKPGSTILLYGLLVSGYVLVIHGFLNWFGNAHYRDAVLGNRLSGVFQYPNTYAAYLIGLLLASLVVMVAAKKWYWIIAHALMLVPIFVSLLLTLSRGGLVVLPIAVIVCLLFLPWRKQLFVLLYLVLAAVPALAVFGKLTAIRTQLAAKFAASVSQQGWFILILCSLAVAIVVWAIHRFAAIPWFRKNPAIKKFRPANAVIPCILFVSALAGAYLLFGNSGLAEKLPNGLKQRIESVSLEDSSIAGRAVFYKDSFKILQDYPVLGAAGGAWASLYPAYQSYPYTSRQTHNVISQILVETGLIGAIVFIFFLGYLCFIYIRGERGDEPDESKLAFPVFAFALLIHSAIDFDMSYVFLSALVFLCLGTMASATAAGKR